MKKKTMKKISIYYEICYDAESALASAPNNLQVIFLFNTLQPKILSSDAKDRREKKTRVHKYFESLMPEIIHEKSPYLYVIKIYFKF